MSDSQQMQNRILLVDDNATNLQVLYRTLDNMGYDLLVAKDGETALEVVGKAPPVLILLDIRMPGMDGFEVCRRLKADASTREIPVIFLSAEDEDSAKVRGLEMGAVDYITKPFNTDEVVARVKTHVKLRRLELQLERRNEELEDENKQILNAVYDGIVGISSEGRITSMNPRAIELTRWSAASAIGEPLHTLGWFGARTPGVRDEDTLLYRSYHGGELIHLDRQALQCKDGSVEQIALHCAPRAEGGAVLVMRDIGEWLENQAELQKAREELDRQRQSMAHIERLSTGGEMAAGIAHEVNQPLTAISNYARVLDRMLGLDNVDKSKLTEAIQKLLAQAERASEIIQQFRNFLRQPSEGRSNIALNDSLRAVVALAEVDSRVNQVDIHTDFADDLPMVSFDEVQFQQVALNLIRNAMEASRDTPNQAEGVVVKTWQEDGLVCYAVIDRGVGVPPDKQDTLFTPFISSKNEGMGIGLSISQTLVQAHSGDLHFSPNPEGGAIFTVKLPAVD